MADGVDIPTVTGTTIATDDVAGVQYQRIKMCWGVDGAANDASAAKPLPINCPNTYELVLASQPDQVLGAGSGAIGDYIAGVLVIPSTTSPGMIYLTDNGYNMVIFTGGTGSVSNLVPFYIPLGIVSRNGAWKLTTGANATCIAMGVFT